MSILLSTEDFLNVSETTDAFQKTLDSVKEVVECRADIIIQRKEKHQQVLDYQTEKLKKEKEEYLKKSENLLKELEASKNRLLQLEYSIASAQSDKSAQEEANCEIVERLKKYELDIKKKHTQFLNTTRLLAMVIGYYKNYMDVTIELDKHNPNIVFIILDKIKMNLVYKPYLKIEVIEKNKFKFLDVYPALHHLLEIKNEPVEHFEAILTIFKFREHVYLT